MKLSYAEKKLKELEQKKKCSAQDFKAAKELVLNLKKKTINPVSLNKAFKASMEILSDVAVVLNIIQICPTSGAVVERGFSLMNLIMNDLRSSMKVATLDALMRIHYHDELLSKTQMRDIISICKNRGNRRIEL